MCWDREGKLVKTLTTGETCETGVVDELGEAEYVYTGAGERVIRADAEAVTIYLPGGQEVTIPRDATRNVSAHRYYTFNGETIAVRDQRGLGGVTSLVNDHHGTSIVAIPNTAWTPTSVRKQYADPFGATRGKNAAAAASMADRDGNGTPGDHGFLGKSNDITGLTQVGARYYDGSTGAFIAPDPLLDLASPKQWNAYAYGNQSPVTQSDPTGLMVLDSPGGGGGATGDSDCYPGSAGCGQPPSTSGGTSSGGGSTAFPGAEPVEVPDDDPIGQPVIDWVEHNQDSLIDASLAGAEMAAWGLLSALAGVGAVACGAEAVVTSPTVVAAAPGVACAAAAGGGAAAAGYQAGKSGDRLADAILKMESAPGKSAAKGADDGPVISGILRDASKSKGNFGVGSGTKDQAMRAGESWVGEGYRVASDGKTLVSRDGLRSFRPPSWKPRLGKWQANFEYWIDGQVARKPMGNGHLDITDMEAP